MTSPLKNVNVNGGFSSINADFGHTTHFYIDSKTRGYTLTSASGHNYASPKNAVDGKAWALYE